MAKVRIDVKSRVGVDIPTFDEFDRTDIIIGVGEIFGRDGYLPRTDLGRWWFDIPIGDDTAVFNVFMYDDGSVCVNGLDDRFIGRINVEPIMNEIRKMAKPIYEGLMREKYQPLFDKYGFKSWRDIVALNMSQKGVYEWLLIRWKKEEIVVIDGESVQNGNLGMHIHTWHNKGELFNASIEYYIDFPGKVFKPNCYGGHQREEEIAEWGKKISVHEANGFKLKKERDEWIVNVLDRFKNGELVWKKKDS